MTKKKGKADPKESPKETKEKTVKGDPMDSKSLKQTVTASKKSAVVPEQKSKSAESRQSESDRISRPKAGHDKDKDDVDEIFAAKPKKTKKEPEPVARSSKAPKSDKDEIAREADKYKGTSSQGGRKFVDGLPLYSLEELQEEMGDSAWDAFIDAAEPGLT